MSLSIKKLLGTSLATTAALIAFAPSVSADEVYTIQSGDTLSTISREFSVSINDVRQANGLSGDLIFAGAKLTIPTAEVQTTQNNTTNSSTANTEIYTVVAGDTLNKIGARFDTTAQKIRDLNGISGDLIIVGQQLRISGSATKSTVEATPVEETPAEETQASALNANGKYVVQSGDWLSKIANEFDTTVANLRALNGISGDLIYVGQTLTVSGSVEAAPVVESAPVVEAAPVVEEKVVEVAPVVEAARPTQVTPTRSAQDIIGFADNYLGTPYSWGGKTPAGFDCSGFVYFVYQNVRGVNVGGYTGAQQYAGPQISVSAAQPGDLIFWGTQGNPYHVAIYVGNNQFIHAPQPGQSVTYGTISSYWAPAFAVSMAAYN